MRELGVQVQMRDGVLLATDLHGISGDDPRPAVLTRTPYGKSLFFVEAEPLVAAGYAVVVQDVRGRHDSDGTWRPYFDEGHDGYDTVEWVAAQPWCDGNVGMFGASYGGWTQWAAARERPPHLRTFISSVCCALWAGEWPWINGVLYPGGVAWLNTVAGRVNQDLDVSVLSRPAAPLRTFQERFERSLPMADEWLQHPSLDDYWEPIALGDSDFRTIDLPVLHLTGWFDGCQRSSHWLYEQMLEHASSEQALIVGPWDHTLRSMQRSYDGVDFGDQAVIDYYGERIAWFDRWLRGSATGPAGARTFVTGADLWRTFPTFPPSSAVSQWWHPGPDGMLRREVSEGVVGFRYDPADPVLTRPPDSPASYPSLDRASVLQRPDVLVWTSAALVEDLEVAGGPVVELQVSSDRPDTDWFAELVDLGPEGNAFLVGHGLQRMRFRTGVEELVVPGEVVAVTIDLTPRAHRFLAGHRIALAVTSSGAPLWASNTNGGGNLFTEEELYVAHNRVHLSGSRVLLSVVPVGKH